MSIPGWIIVSSGVVLIVASGSIGLYYKISGKVPSKTLTLTANLIGMVWYGVAAYCTLLGI